LILADGDRTSMMRLVPGPNVVEHDLTLTTDANGQIADANGVAQQVELISLRNGHDTIRITAGTAVYTQQYETTDP
jgi:hypothetical protein